MQAIEQVVLTIFMHRAELQIYNLPIGLYGIYQSGHLVQSQSVNHGDSVSVTVDVDGDEVDVVLLRC